MDHFMAFTFIYDNLYKLTIVAHLPLHVKIVLQENCFMQ
jgi:hypothetical protein